MRSTVGMTLAAAVTGAVVLAGCSGGTNVPGGGSAGGGDGAGGSTTLRLESWRPEDASVWTNKILPAFTKEHPNIKVQFAPTNANEYDAAMTSRFQGGSAGDLITCRSYELNRAVIRKGYLEPIAGLKGLDQFDKVALDTWADDKGKPYCIPAASVMAGFFYNKDIFDKLGLKPPQTQDEFIQVLDRIKADGKYAPLAMGGAGADAWTLSYMGLDSIGPNYWHGMEGYNGLQDGKMKATDPQFVAAFKALDSWKPYLPKGFASVTYADATQMFALGKAAIFPSGSWDINAVTANGLKVGVFGPPVPHAGDQRYLQDHPDMGIGINAASKHKAAARTFLEWVASPKFQTLYANALPGFFGMSKASVQLQNNLAQDWLHLRDGAKLSPRLGLDKMAVGNPNWETKVEPLLDKMLTGALSPEEVAAQMQKTLETSYKPQQQ